MSSFCITEFGSEIRNALLQTWQKIPGYTETCIQKFSIGLSMLNHKIPRKLHPNAQLWMEIAGCNHRRVLCKRRYFFEEAGGNPVLQGGKLTKYCKNVNQGGIKVRKVNKSFSVTRQSYITDDKTEFSFEGPAREHEIHHKFQKIMFLILNFHILYLLF